MSEIDEKQGQERAASADALRRRLAELDAQVAEFRRNEAKLVRLATFPVQNPNLVIETDLDGQVTYLNPVAQTRFPDLYALGARHRLLRDLPAIIDLLQQEAREYVARELDVGDAVFEQKICSTGDGSITGIRIFAHDITARKRAEEAIQTLAQQVVSAQEEERQRVSRELHDEAGQALTALKISLELMQADLPDDTILRQNFAEAIALTEDTRERIRLLARGLRPPSLDTVGLNPTLEDFCRDFARRTKINIQYDGRDVAGLSDAVAIGLYRFLQEALTNVARHAAAGEVQVRLWAEPRRVVLRVADDGRGFQPAADPGDGRRAGGIGLVGLQERLELLGGRLRVDSHPGAGTVIEASLPVRGAP